MFFTQSNIFARVNILLTILLYMLLLKKPSACSLILNQGYPTGLNLCEKIAFGKIIYLFGGDSKQSNLSISFHVDE